MNKGRNYKIKLKPALYAFVASRVGDGGEYATAAEYVRDLIRRDMLEAEAKTLM